MEKLNSKKIGNTTEIKCMSSFIELGYNVLIPFGDCERYDFVADVNGKFIRIQCKTSKQEGNTNSSFGFSCRSSYRKNGHTINRKYNDKEIDYFATFYENKCYLIPVELCGSYKKLRLKNATNKQVERINFAQDYELEVILKTL